MFVKTFKTIIRVMGVGGGLVILLFLSPAKRSLGQGNFFTRVCHSVYREGVSVSVLRVSVRGGVSVRKNPPYGKERAVRILLECILLD